jgi:heme-degrading monooxygenase HmoA
LTTRPDLVHTSALIAQQCKTTVEGGRMSGITIEERTAPKPDRVVDGPVTLMNRFAVTPDRDEAFHALWESTSEYFRAQPGFVSLRLHRAVSSEAEYRWVNVATWESEAAFRAAHDTEEFRRVVTQPGWKEFPSSPMLFQVVTSVG